jgi:DNA-binding NarL/FixJ family response regulator
MIRYKKILLVDDHGLIREGAGLLLRTLSPEIQIVHAASPEVGKEEIQRDAPDLVFLDLGFGDDARAGLGLLEWMKASDEYDAIPVIIMSGERFTREEVEPLLEKRAAGYLCKAVADAEIFKLALMSMEAGVVFIHGARPAGSVATGAGHAAKRDAKSLGLTPALHRVLVRHVKGMPYKRIARELNIAEPTVRQHIAEICRIFKVVNAKALIFELARAGFALDENP